jgi:hypothetical protein
MRKVFALVLAGFLASAAQAAPSPAKTPEQAAPGDKVICKRFLKVGSLVDGYKTCKTKHEWERERENARQFGVSDSCNKRGEAPALCR